jgi:integrase
MFSYNQLPNDEPIKVNSICDVASKYLKLVGLNITGYALKYTYPNMVSNKFGITKAKELAGHTKETTTRIYAVDYEEQQVEKNKNIDICI